MDYMTTQEAAVKWNVSPRSVTRYIKAGKIPGAVQKGKSWLIPQAADRPRDGRDRKRAGMNILPTRFEKKDDSFRFTEIAARYIFWDRAAPAVRGCYGLYQSAAGRIPSGYSINHQQAAEYHL